MRRNPLSATCGFSAPGSADRGASRRSSSPVTAGGGGAHLGAERYAAYLETPAGRLRCELAFANLQEFLPRQAPGILRALDLGSGTGEIGIRLARLGFHVTLLDHSPQMLEASERAARRAGVSSRVALTQGDVAASPSLFPEGSFDVIVCHHVLEYTPHPALVIRGAARVLRRVPQAILSVVARNRAGAVLSAAIQSGDLAAAERALMVEAADRSPNGGGARLFTPAELRAMLTDASCEPVAERGVRVVFDYLPASAGCEAGADRVVALERALGARAEFSAVARYTQLLARPNVDVHARVEGGTQ